MTHTIDDLDADQSCAACGATAIQLVPLQRDVSLCCLTLYDVRLLYFRVDDVPHVRLVPFSAARSRRNGQRRQVPAGDDGVPRSFL